MTRQVVVKDIRSDMTVEVFFEVIKYYANKTNYVHNISIPQPDRRARKVTREHVAKFKNLDAQSAPEVIVVGNGQVIGPFETVQ